MDNNKKHGVIVSPLQRIVNNSNEFLGADVSVLYLFDMETGEFLPEPLVAGELRKPLIVKERPRRTGGMAARVREAGMVVVDDLAMQPDMHSSFTRNENIRSFVGVALTADDEFLGVLYVNFRAPHHFTLHEQRVIHSYADQAAAIIREGRLLERLAAFNNEVAALHEAGQALTTSLELPEVLSRIGQTALEVLGADLIVLHQYYEVGRRFELPPMVAGELLDTGFPPPTEVRPDDAAAVIVRLGKAHFVSDATSDELVAGPDDERRPQRFVAREKIRSVAAIPLRIRDETVGIMFVNYRTPQRFDERQRRVIDMFARYAAIAIQNARLFGGAARELQRRLAELEALRDVDRSIIKASSLSDPRTTLLRIVDKAMEITKATTGNIMLLDRARGDLALAAARGTGTPEGARLPVAETSISGWVALHRRAALIRDVRTDEPWNHIYADFTPTTRAELTVPLMRDNTLVGILNMEHPQPGAFDEHDLWLLEALADQAVIAIQNAERYESAQRAQADLEALIEIDRKISSTLERDEVLNLILDKSLELTGAPSGNVMLLDPVRGDLMMVAGKGEEAQHKGARQRRDQGIVGLAARTQELQRIDDVTAPPWDKIYLQFIPKIHSELAVPMVRDGNLVGILNVESPQVGAFDERHERLLRAMAGQAVIAIQNAQRYEQLEALREIDQVIIQTLELDEVIRPILTKALQLAQAEWGDVTLYDEAGNEMATYVVTGPGPEIRKIEAGAAPHDLVAVKGIVNWVAHNKEPFLSKGNVQQDPRYRGFEYIRSEVAVPLLGGQGQVVGVLNLESEREDAFNQEHVNILEMFARQMVIALRDTQVAIEAVAAKRRGTELESMASVGQSAAEIAHRIGNSLGTIKTYVHQIRQAVGEANPVVNRALDNILRDTGQILKMSKQLKDELASERDIPSQKKPIPSQALLSETSLSYPVPEGVQVTINCPDSIPPVFASDHVFAVFANLFTNAVQALPEMGGRVELGAREAGDFIEFWVQDNGHGIREESLSRIFDLFHTTKPGAFGFGLWSAKRRVLSNGGTISVHSVWGQGTTFTVRLPKYRADQR